MNIYLNNLEYRYEIYELIRSLIGRDNIFFIDDENEKNNLLSLYIEEDINIKFYKKGEEVYTYHVENFKDESTEFFKEKMVIKYYILKFFKEYFNISSNWGVLTGIRPVKIVRKLINKYGIEETRNILENNMKLSHDKNKLVTDITLVQKEHISRLKENSYSIYINIPFCPTRCDYCSFSTLRIDKHGDLVPLYLKTIIYELKSLKMELEKYNLSTIYIGGGTPSTLSNEELKILLEYLNENFVHDDLLEFTVEAGREDTLSYSKLKILKKYGVTRISLNPQSFNENTLNLIGRKQNNKELIKRYYEAVNLEFDCINMDLIIGLPKEDLNDLENTLNEVKKLQPSNLTVHTLAVKKGSKIDEKNINLEDEKELVSNMMNMAMEFAKDNNYIPYYLYRQKQILGNMENIGFSKKGKECIYNITMMEEEENIIGIGMGASSKFIKANGLILNHRNFMNMRDYLNSIDRSIEEKRILLGENND